jgi:hypothetical protein
MKKRLYILIPLTILISALSLVLLYSLFGKKGFSCNNDQESGIQVGMKYFQPLVNKIEDYKVNNGKYPSKLEEINQSILGNGLPFPDKNITGASINLKPDENYFTLGFNFNNDYICLVGQVRRCTYQSSVFWSGKDTETGKWVCD